MRSLVAMSFATLMLCACGKTDKVPDAASQPAAPAAATAAAPPAPTGPVQGKAESALPEKVKVPAPVPASQELFAGLSAGGSAILRLDACPTGFDAHAHLASVMCGKDYTVFYEPMNLRWVAIGPNADLKAPNNINAGKNPGPVASEHIIVVWGLSFTVDPKSYKAAVGDGTVVGHLVHSGASMSVPAAPTAPASPVVATPGSATPAPAKPPTQ